MSRFTLVFAAASLAAFCLSSQAQPVSPYPIVTGQIRVSYAGLDLNDRHDASLMLGRIETAARRACGGMAERDPAYRTNTMFVEKARLACRTDAVRRTVTEMNLPLLTRAYAEAYEVPHARTARQ